MSAAKTWGLRRCILSLMPRATSSRVNSPGLLGDHRVEVDLQQQVAELLAQVVGVAGVDRLEGLGGLLLEVARQRAMGLLALPGAVAAQPPHVVEEVEQRLAARPSVSRRPARRGSARGVGGVGLRGAAAAPWDASALSGYDVWSVARP